MSGLAYDSLGQMTNADGWWGAGTFNYDGLGNITSKTLGTRLVTMDYDPTTNLIWRAWDRLDTPDGGYGYRGTFHDGRGNMIQAGNLFMTYDMTDQMVGTSQGTSGLWGWANATYQYNGEGKRVLTNMNGRENYSMYDASGSMVATYKVHDGELVERVSLQGGHALAKWTGSTLTYLHTDHLGTPVRGTHGLGTTATPGAEVFQDFNTPYGLQSTHAWHGDAGSGFEPKYGPGSNCGVTGFTTHVKDCRSGLTYMQARYYDPAMGRFLSVDPVTFMQTGDPAYFNRYAYAGNNPINNTDAYGNCFGPAAIPCVIGAVGLGKAAHSGYKAYKAVRAAKAVSASVVVTGTLKTGVDAVSQDIDDGTELVRGGDGSKPWSEGTGVTENPDGTLEGVSTAGEAGSTTEETAATGRIRNGKIRTTTVGEIESLSGTVTPDGGTDGNHCTVSGCTAEELDEAFSEPKPNPNKGGKLE